MMASWGQRPSVAVSWAAATRGQAPLGLCLDTPGMNPCHEAGLILDLVPPHWVPRALAIQPPWPAAAPPPASPRPTPQAPGAHPGWHCLLTRSGPVDAGGTWESLAWKTCLSQPPPHPSTVCPNHLFVQLSLPSLLWISLDQQAHRPSWSFHPSKEG